MIQIIGISGSLRKGSYNTALLRAAQSLMPQGSQLEVALLEGIPLYHGDEEEKHGIPEAVTKLKEKIISSQGLILATPEYNNSIPGVFKNAIDWLSRPPADIAKVFHGRPVALMGATPGQGGTLLAQNAWLPVLKTLGTLSWNGGRQLVSRAHQVFNESGELTDAGVRENLQKFLTAFVGFIQEVGPSKKS